MNKKRELAEICLGFAGALFALWLLVLFNNKVLMLIPLAARMIAMIITYLCVAAVPFIIFLVRKDKLSDYGFSKEKLLLQCAVGVGVGLVFSLVFTLLPHLLGLGGWVDNGKRYLHLWQFAYDFAYCILAVGLTEEFIFRGFFYAKIKKISNTAVAVVASSVLFGFFHLFLGNIVQMIVTAVLGLIFCLCREKIKHCSTLSLVIAHGVYDAMIGVFASLLLQ